MNTASLDKETEFNTPFENIALAFSGGGFRAASYALGVLSYLNHVTFNELDGTASTLLKKVTYLSSASGGTIATATYARYSVEGKSFFEYYTMLYKAIEGDYLLNETLNILTTAAAWRQRPEKSRNLINAFALAYDKHLFEGKTLESLLPVNGANLTHLQEVCFNTTEFYRGLLFRQQIKLQSDSKDDKGFLYGNFVINLEHEAAKHLKLSDLLAASSCFPGGFEPIIFPNDFVHGSHTPSFFINNLKLKLQSGGLDELKFLFGDLPPDKLKHNREILINHKPGQLVYKRLPKIGFMDGGITDNQGLESMMRAQERRQKEETAFTPFDLMLVNDVGSHFMDPYRLPEINPKKLLSSWSIRIWILLIGAALMAGAFSMSFMFRSQLPLIEKVLIVAGVLIFPVSLILLGLYLFIAFKLYAKKPVDDSGFNLNKNFAPGIIKTLVQYFTKSPLKVIFQMLKTRGASFLILNNDVFLKRIRKLLYDKLFDKALYDPKWKYRGKGNHVYDLTFSNNFNRKERNTDCPPYLEPTEPIQIVAENAFSMATTLWFDRARSKVTHKQACLVACGQFTTCYNLLEYIEKLENDKVIFDALSAGYKARVTEIKECLRKDYEHFKTDPFFLYNEIGLKTAPNFDVIKYADIPFPVNFKGL